MKTKLQTFGTILLSMVGMTLLFILIVGIGNYFQGIGQKTIGNVFMAIFPIATYFVVTLFNRKINKLNDNQCGFGFKHFISNFFLGIGLALVTLLVILLITKAFIDIDIELSGLKNDFQTPLVSLLTTLFIVGVWEEFYFRGLVFNTLLKGNFGFHLSALISSILFSVIHWSSFDMAETSWFWYLGIVFMGYILVYIYVLTDSIWSVVSFHFFWNFIATLLDGNENEIGLIKVSNYLEYSKSIDNVTVICLGIFLLVILVLAKTKAGNGRIKSYRNKITT